MSGAGEGVVLTADKKQLVTWSLWSDVKVQNCALHKYRALQLARNRPRTYDTLSYKIDILVFLTSSRAVIHGRPVRVNDLRGSLERQIRG